MSGRESCASSDARPEVGTAVLDLPAERADGCGVARSPGVGGLDFRRCMVLVDPSLRCFVLAAEERRVWEGLDGASLSPLASRLRIPLGRVQRLVQEFSQRGLAGPAGAVPPWGTVPRRAEERPLLQMVYVETGGPEVDAASGRHGGASPPERSPGGAPADGKGLRRILDEISRWSSYHIGIALSHDCRMRERTEPFLDLVLRDEARGVMRPLLLLESHCPDCARRFLEEGTNRRIVLLRVEGLAQVRRLSRSDDRLVLVVDGGRHPPASFARLLRGLAREFPESYLKAILPEGPEEALLPYLEAIRRLPRAGLYDCGAQRLFIALSAMAPYSSYCREPLVRRLAVDLSGSVFPCRGLVSRAPLGNLLEEDLGSILLGPISRAFTEAMHARMEACLPTCPLTFACSGCPAVRCGEARAMLRLAVSSASRIAPRRERPPTP